MPIKKLKPVVTKNKKKPKNKHKFGVWKIPKNAVIVYGNEDPTQNIQE